MKNEKAHADDLAFARMRGRIQHIYAEAERDIRRKMEAFTKRFQEKDKENRAKVEAGEMTQAQYDSWLRGQVFRGEQWKKAREDIERQIYRANQTATGIINDERKAVFQDAANYSAFQIEKGTKGAVSFDLYDSATVTRLLKEDKKLLPEYKINESKDFRWNNRKVNNAVTQGIIQGEGIDKIARRLSESLESSNRAKMITFARTAATGAQNAGRIEAMHEAEEQGIKVKKRWIATLDSRTRDTHAELDGHEVDADEPFVVDGQEIMFPGDPNADPSLVYNCRCTLGWAYPDYPSSGQRRDNETGEIIDDVTYREWESAKQKQDKENTWFDASNLNISIRGNGDYDQDEINKVLSLAGAEYLSPTNDDNVRIHFGKNGVTARITNNKMVIGVVWQKEDNSLYIDDANAVIKGQGVGTEWMKDVVEKSKEAGIDKITLYAVGDVNSKDNGYYTWARMGFDGDLSSEQKSLAVQHGFDVSRVSELMATEEGREYWKEYGSGLQLEMSLGKNSKELKAFEEYLANRTEGKQRKKSTHF